MPLYEVERDVQKILLHFLEPFSDVTCGLILIGLSTSAELGEAVASPQ
jgi:hypothetical protein